MELSFPHYRQLDKMDCGPTCLQIIAKYYGKVYTLQHLREKCYITRRGVSMLGISDAAKDIGMQTRCILVELREMCSDVALPCILHFNQNHFVVCYKIKKRHGRYYFYISDPAKGKYKLNEIELKRCWLSNDIDKKEQGIALLIQPTSMFYSNKGDSSVNRISLKFYLNYLHPYSSEIGQLIVGMALSSIFTMILPFLTQAVVDHGINFGDLSFVTLILLCQLVIFFTQTAVNFLQNWITLNMNTKISIALISDFLVKLMRLPLRFFDSKNIGDIMQRIDDHSRIQSFMTGTTLTSLLSFINFFVLTFVMACYSLTLLTVFAVGNALYLIWIISFMRYRRRLDNARFVQSSVNRSNLVQLVTGMQEIKLNNSEQRQRWLWESIQVKLFKISIKSMALGQYQQMGSVFFSQTTNLIISFVAAKYVIEGSITLGMMMAITSIIGQLSIPINQFINFTQSLQDAKISLERLNEIHNRKDEDQTTGFKCDALPSDGSFTFENVCFSYDGATRDYILENLNLHIPQNKVTAIVGASGSGKTTIIKLLLGFYSPVKGRLKIGNVEMNDIIPHLWRSQVGAVMQDGFIFSDTIENNITICDEKADRKRLEYAVKMANIEDFIEALPLGFQTKIGMEGNGLSQGQKQRLLIARAIYKNPQYLFFDEATNALDSNNEKIIMNNLNHFYSGKTVVIAAHRLSTVKNADKIIVLDHGKVIEEGTHQSLTEKRGVYFTLVKNQLVLDE